MKLKKFNCFLSKVNIYFKALRKTRRCFCSLTSMRPQVAIQYYSIDISNNFFCHSKFVNAIVFQKKYLEK